MPEEHHYCHFLRVILMIYEKIAYHD